MLDNALPYKDSAVTTTVHVDAVHVGLAQALLLYPVGWAIGACRVGGDQEDDTVLTLLLCGISFGPQHSLELAEHMLARRHSIYIHIYVYILSYDCVHESSSVRTG